MEKTAIIVTVVSSLISGILGVIISNLYYKRQQSRQTKINLLIDIFAYRFQLNETSSGKELTSALNKIIIVFNNNEKVMEKYKNFISILQSNRNKDDNLIWLLKEMCDDVNISYKFMSDELFKVFINIG